MTERTNDTERAPSEPAEDPKVSPQPPSNPEVDQEEVDRGQEQIEKISGN
jgi:hypothetical protein